MPDSCVVLAFSGGLDTSFCVVALQEQGYEVHTVYAHSGVGQSGDREAVERRARELGAASHVTVEIGEAIWQSIVIPLVWSGELYQGQYPLLVSDRYAIVEACVARAREVGAQKIAHGSTAMGNDQVRFDHAIRALGKFEIVAPVRDLQGIAGGVREFEADFLRQRGFDVPARVRRYTINENLLGVTISGSEIDSFEIPASDARAWCVEREAWPGKRWRSVLQLEHGVVVGRDGRKVSGPELLAQLNAELSQYGVGRGIYCGDTIVGLKGRIVFEAPGLTALLVAHRALEEAVLTRAQNRFKPLVARQWVEMIYEGLRYDPLTRDLERFLESSQDRVSGEVELESTGGTVRAVRVSSPNLLLESGARYAQSADWSAANAEGFVRLHGLSTISWMEKSRDVGRDTDAS